MLVLQQMKLQPRRLLRAAYRYRRPLFTLKTDLILTSRSMLGTELTACLTVSAISWTSITSKFSETCKEEDSGWPEQSRRFWKGCGKGLHHQRPGRANPKKKSMISQSAKIRLATKSCRISWRFCSFS